jgi:hypothetical protein
MSKHNKALTELAAKSRDTADRILAQAPTSKRAKNLGLICDACSALVQGDKQAAEYLIERIQLKGDREVETAMLDLLKILLDMP